MIKKIYNSQPDNGSIQESNIRDALARVLKSIEFAQTKRVGLFLEFIVEEALAGRGDRLKAFTIALEVYGRDESFNQRKDTIVRVEAGRLRQRLSKYYETEGCDDPLIIELPKGGYTPTFKWNENARINSTNTTHETRPSPDAYQNTNLMTLGYVALITIVLALAVWFYSLTKYNNSVPSDSEMIVDYQALPSTLFLVILPLETFTQDSVEAQLAAGLVESIITDMAKLSGISVMAHTSLLNLNERANDLSAIKHDFGATHALRGSLEREGEVVRVNVQLVDITSSTTIWADRLDVELDNLLDLQDLLSERIVDHLAVQVSKVEHRRLRKHHSNNPEVLALYRQALVLMMPPNDAQRVITARHVFNRIIDLDPEFAGGYAGKSFTHTVTALFLKTSEPEIELQKGVNLSLKAIETDPEFGMGYVTLALVYAMSNREEEALFNAKQAISVQPGDAFTQFIYGMCLTLSGRAQEAIDPLTEAIRLDPAEPRTPYRNVLGLTHFVVADYSRAVELFEENQRNKGPAGPHMDSFRAATYAKLGNDGKARSIIKSMNKSHPNFPTEIWLKKWLTTSNDLSSIIDTLYQLGLQRP